MLLFHQRPWWREPLGGRLQVDPVSTVSRVTNVYRLSLEA